MLAFMSKLDPLEAKAEKELELYFLNKVMECVKEDMPLQEILNVLERVRHIVTEIKIGANHE